MSADVYAFRRNLVLAASAGTGKTHTLVGVLLHAMLGASELGGEGAHEPIDPSRIVATTFSRKAAAEIRERIVVELSALASDAPSASGYFASMTLAAERLGISWNDAVVTRRARGALARIGQASIGTLHGFAYAIARTYALERGLPPGFALLEEEETLSLCEGAVERALVALRARDPDATRDLVRLSRGTSMLEESLVNLLLRLDEEGQDAAGLVLPSGDAASLDRTMVRLASHAEALLDDAGLGPAARAFLAARKEAIPGPLVAATGALFDFTKSKKSPALIALADLRDETGTGKNLLRGERFARRWLLRDRILPTADTFRQLVAEAQREMRAGLAQRAGLGFGAVLGAARDALRDEPHAAAELSERYDVLLVDEFQDTSRLQRDLIALLWEREPLKRSPGVVPSLSQVRPSGLLVVGDRKQSIYSFRGADVAVFTETCVALAGEAARVALAVPEGACVVPASPSADFHALRVNYRASPEILRFANAFSAICLRGTSGTLAEVRYVEDTEALLAPAGKTLGPEPRVTWLRPAGPRLATDKSEDARLAAMAIVERREQGASWRELAVLAQTNGMLDAMAFELSRRGIPYVVAGRGFFEAQEVQDVLAMLRVLVRRHDRAAWLTVLRGPWAGVSDRTLLGLTELHRGLELDVRRWGDGPRRALIDDGDRATLARVSDTVQRLRRAVARLGPGGALREAVRELGLEEVLVLLTRGEQRIANVRKLLRMADREPHAEVLLEQATRSRENGREAEAATFSDEDDAVRLLTVHGSKGLAFPVVILPELGKRPPKRGGEPFLVAQGAVAAELRLATKLLDERGDPQTTPSLDAMWELVVARFDAERRRLLYVAITRAARELVFVGDLKGGRLGEATAWSVLEELSTQAEAVGLRIEERTLGGAPPGMPAGQAVTVAPLEIATMQTDSVAIAATTLQDFGHCPRRFQLVHLLDVSEKSVVPFARATAEREGGTLDARSEGTLLHRVLETVPREAFGAEAPLEEVKRALESAGFDPANKGYARVVTRAERFLRGAYAKEIAERGATLERELPFVLTVEGAGPSVALRGTIDLIVRWPDGALDVIDYKRARGPSVEPHALQLSVYALAAHERFPGTSVRAGIVFLGGTPDTPHFATLPKPAKVRSRLVELVAGLVKARQTERFVRVPVVQCKAIHCGYVELCHPPDGPGQLALFRGT